MSAQQLPDDEDEPQSAVFRMLNRTGPQTTNELGRHPGPDERRIYAIRQFNPRPGTTRIWYLERHDAGRVLKRWLVENRQSLRNMDATQRSLSASLSNRMSDELQFLLDQDHFTFLREQNDGGDQPGETTKIPCPECGVPQGNLPNHLPCDGEADANDE